MSEDTAKVAAERDKWQEEYKRLAEIRTGELSNCRKHQTHIVELLKERDEARADRANLQEAIGEIETVFEDRGIAYTEGERIAPMVARAIDEARAECERLKAEGSHDDAWKTIHELQAACAAMREALDLIYKTATTQPSWASVVADTARKALNHE